MAKQPGLDFQSTRGGSSELKRRLLFVLLALIVFRLGSYVPVPGRSEERRVGKESISRGWGELYKGKNRGG